MQNDWTPVEQVMAHGWLQRHSTLDLLANSVSSQPWLVRTPSRHALQQYMTSQWREESGWWNKHASCHHFWSVCMSTLPPPKILSMHLVFSSILSVNKICILFRRKTMIYLNRILTNPILKEELVSVLVRPEIADLAKLISDNFWSTDMIPDREFGMTQYSLTQ